MSGFVQPTITTNPDDLVADAFDILMAAFPGYEPNESSLEAWLIEVIARMNAETRDVASNVPVSIFRYFGQQLMNIPPINATPATVQTTWTMQDNVGYTIPAGTVAGFTVAGGSLVAFTTTVDVVIPPGSSVTGAGAVTMQAVIDGISGNGYTGGMQLVDPLAFVVSVVATTVSADGVDAEDDTAYLARLSDELQLMAPRPILPNDFAVLSQNVAGVFRALAVDGYNPGDGTTGNARMVAVSPVDSTGAACTAPVKTALQAYLNSKREINFVVNVFDPTYTVINVTTTFAADPGFNVVALEQTVHDAIVSYLSPAVWAGGDQSPPVWQTGMTTVRYLELAAVIGNVIGVAYIETLTVNGGGVDVALAGHAPLPSIGAISATVA